MSDDSTLTARGPYEHSAHPSYCCPFCGKGYSALHHLQAHERSACSLARQSVSDLLRQTKDFWESKKRKRAEPLDVQTTVSPITLKAATGDSTNSPEAGALLSSKPSAEGTEQRYTKDMQAKSGMIHARKRRKPLLPLEPANTSAEELDAPVAIRKGRRERRLPGRFTHDILPEPPPPLFPALDFRMLEAQIALLSPPSVIPTRGTSTEDLVIHETKRSTLGIMRRYSLLPGVFPTHDPDQLAVLHDNVISSRPATSYGPFGNKTAFLLAEWYWNSTNKSFLDFQKLLSILGTDDFSVSDAMNVKWRAAFKALGANKDELNDNDASWMMDDGWMSATVTIDIPFHKQMKEPGVKAYTVGNFRYRSIVSIIREKLSSYADSRHFHYYPYKTTWKKTPDAPDVELYGELYYSRAFREEHERVQLQAPTYHNEGLERVVVALMFWSDATQLTSFGGASLWPAYLFFGNESKTRRGRPSEKLGHQIAYFMKLPDRLNDFLKEKNQGKLPTDALLKYCTRELFHKQWSILLSPDLVDAMKHGIIVQCPDGKRRCFFPRIFSYSADYPEKVLVGGIRNNGACPCHQCLVKQDQLFKLGAPSDTERLHEQRCPADQRSKVAEAQALIDSGYAVNNKGIIEEKLLQPMSLVPVKTAFERNLSDLDFDILSVLVVDILHEFEIGVWKRLYIHLLRLLDAFPTTISLDAELDARYRATPAFGRDTIRKFPTNVSEMKRRAARDYEDLLQGSCSIPAFDSLLPGEHNARLMSLLFICAQWHALAKLRLHNDYTLSLLDYTTAQLGAQMRHFYRETCLKVPTKEGKKEAEARARQEMKDGKQASTARRPITLSVFTIKFHFLGDYTSIIRRLGTTDSYSTQTGELYHREPKSWYPRTDRKDYELQLSRIERRKTRLSRIRHEMCDNLDIPAAAFEEGPVSNLRAIDSTPEWSLDAHYHIGINAARSIDLDFFARGLPDPHHRQDDYLLNFVNLLKRHLLPRLLLQLGEAGAGITDNQWVHIVLRANRIHSHKLLRVNYTTYDVRRAQDVLHIDTPQCNVMLLNDQYKEETWLSEHPYIYGRLLGVFHAEVSYAGPMASDQKDLQYHRLEFAWLHRYQFLGSNGEFTLDRVSPLPITSDGGLEFVDPADIIRSVHLIPQFSQGEAGVPPPKSQFMCNQPTWKTYFINRFVDRDMFMRYQLGMSVGHAYTHTASFPPPCVPTIPLDFDHCTDIHTTLGDNLAAREGVSLHHKGDEGGHSLGAGSSSTTRLEEPEANREESGHGDDDSVDHLDDLSDREVIVFAEMYGDEGYLRRGSILGPESS